MSRTVSLPYSQELPCLCLEVSESVAFTAGRGQRGGRACADPSPSRRAGLRPLTPCGCRPVPSKMASALWCGVGVGGEEVSRARQGGGRPASAGGGRSGEAACGQAPCPHEPAVDGM